MKTFQWTSCCNFDVTIETTGLCGGDGGHGGYTQLTFIDCGDTCMEIAPDEDLEPMPCRLS